MYTYIQSFNGKHIQSSHQPADDIIQTENTLFCLFSENVFFFLFSTNINVRKRNTNYLIIFYLFDCLRLFIKLLYSILLWRYKFLFTSNSIKFDSIWLWKVYRKKRNDLYIFVFYFLVGLLLLNTHTCHMHNHLQRFHLWIMSLPSI